LEVNLSITYEEEENERRMGENSSGWNEKRHI